MATIAPTSLVLGTAFDPATVPDPDRPHPAGLSWVAPLEARPIALGPSADHPVLRPVLDLGADRFWSGARAGREIGPAEIDLDKAVLRQAMSANPRQGYLRVAVAEAAERWTQATTRYAQEMSA